MKRAIGNFFALLGLVTIGAVAYWLLFAPGPSPEEVAARQEAARQRVCTSEIYALAEARMRSHDVIRAGLRSPSTADFPGANNPGVEMRRLENCRWQMVSFVDAQNGFGATVRTAFQVQLTGDPESGTYSVDSISLLE